MIQGKRILIVDDEPDIVFVLKRGLATRGFVVEGFADPREALSQFRPNYYDAIVSDIRMPHLTGIELYIALRAKDGSPPVYFMSAYEINESEIHEKVADAEFVKFIKKPFNYTALADMLDRDLGKKRVTA